MLLRCLMLTWLTFQRHSLRICSAARSAIFHRWQPGWKGNGRADARPKRSQVSVIYRGGSLKGATHITVLQYVTAVALFKVTLWQNWLVGAGAGSMGTQGPCFGVRCPSFVLSHWNGSFVGDVAQEFVFSSDGCCKPCANSAAKELYKQVHSDKNYKPTDTIAFLECTSSNYTRQLPASWLEGAVDLLGQEQVVRPGKRLEEGALMQHRTPWCSLRMDHRLPPWCPLRTDQRLPPWCPLHMRLPRRPCLPPGPPFQRPKHLPWALRAHTHTLWHRHVKQTHAHTTGEAVRSHSQTCESLWEMATVVLLVLLLACARLLVLAEESRMLKGMGGVGAALFSWTGWWSESGRVASSHLARMHLFLSYGRVERA